MQHLLPDAIAFRIYGLQGCTRLDQMVAPLGFLGGGYLAMLEGLGLLRGLIVSEA